MNDEKIELSPLSIDVLFEGLNVDFGIYYLTDSGFALLCKDVVLTAEIMEQLKERLGGSLNIYMQKAERDRIFNSTDYFIQFQKQLEDKIGYTDMKENTDKFLLSVSKSGYVNLERSQTMSSDIKGTLDEVGDAVIVQCLNSVRKTDEYLFTHSLNVAMLNGLIGKWMGFTEDQIKKLIRVGLMHDLGKLKIPTEILNKPGKLTEEEYNIMKMHSQYSFDILRASGETDPEILAGARSHHEKMTGLGYPDGLHADQIPMFACITAISDVYDAMVARRVYKEPQSPFDVLHEFSLGRYSDLDTSIVNIFLNKMPLELVGKKVILTDGSIGTVAYSDSRNLKFPLVNIDGKILKTSTELRCVSIL